MALATTSAVAEELAAAASGTASRRSRRTRPRTRTAAGAAASPSPCRDSRRRAVELRDRRGRSPSSPARRRGGRRSGSMLMRLVLGVAPCSAPGRRRRRRRSRCSRPARPGWSCGGRRGPSQRNGFDWNVAGAPSSAAGSIDLHADRGVRADEAHLPQSMQIDGSQIGISWAMRALLVAARCPSGRCRRRAARSPGSRSPWPAASSAVTRCDEVGRVRRTAARRGRRRRALGGTLTLVQVRRAPPSTAAKFWSARSRRRACRRSSRSTSLIAAIASSTRQHAGEREEARLHHRVDPAAEPGFAAATPSASTT